jgi:hypothetical protein
MINAIDDLASSSCRFLPHEVIIIATPKHKPLGLLWKAVSIFIKRIIKITIK